MTVNQPASLSHAYLAQLQVGMYGQMFGWNFFSAAPAVWGAKVIDGVTVIVLRGSVDFLDFWKDIQAIADPMEHTGLGPVHPGFMVGLEQVWKDIQKHTSGPYIVTGHSLGAARAALLTGLMCLDQRPPIARVVWGEPLSGFGQLAERIGKVHTTSYRNGDKQQHDPVTDVPVAVFPEFYVRASKLTDICVPPQIGLSLDWHHMPLVGWHDMALYAQGMPTTTVTNTKEIR